MESEKPQAACWLHKFKGVFKNVYLSSEGQLLTAQNSIAYEGKGVGSEESGVWG